MSDAYNERHGYAVRYLADLVGGEIVGNDDVHVTGINRIEFAGPGDCTFLSNPSYAKFLTVTQAGVIIVSRALLSHELPSGRTYIITDDAYRGFVLVMQKFFPPLRMEGGLRHTSASIHPSAVVDALASIGPGCVISEGCVVGPRAQLFANVVLYPGCHVGSDTVIHANVTLGAGTRVGQRCLIHPGAVLGADGFGFFENPDGSFEKIPQVGTVELGDDVEIGANVTIDRAAVGTTRIGNGVKLDNLVHIAHNVDVGENTAMAAQTGISGSARIGKRNRFGGQVGMVGHVATADDVIVEAQSGVSKAITAAGAYLGSPAKEHRTALRLEAALRQIPRLLQDVRDLQRQIDEMNKTSS